VAEAATAKPFPGGAPLSCFPEGCGKAATHESVYGSRVNAAEKAKAEPRKRHPRGRLARIKGLIGEQPALIIGACLLLLGLVLVAFVAKVLDLSDGALLAIVFLFPLIAYLIMTRQLSELGAGGLTAKFRDAAGKPLAGSVQRITVEDTQMIEKLGHEEFVRIQALERERPVVLSLVLGARGDRYRTDALRQYVNVLSEFPRFEFVVFLDAQERAIAYLPSDAVNLILQTNTTAKTLIDPVNEGHLPGLAALQNEFLAVEMRVEDALRLMTRLRLETIPVRDDDRRLLGIAERTDLLCRFLLEVTRS
jgi:CBS domain